MALELQVSMHASPLACDLVHILRPPVPKGAFGGLHTTTAWFSSGCRHKMGLEALKAAAEESMSSARGHLQQQHHQQQAHHLAWGSAAGMGVNCSDGSAGGGSRAGCESSTGGSGTEGGQRVAALPDPIFLPPGMDKTTDRCFR